MSENSPQNQLPSDLTTLVGQPLSDYESLLKAAYAKVRIGNEDTMFSMDFVEDRLTVTYDSGSNKITRVSFG